MDMAAAVGAVGGLRFLAGFKSTRLHTNERRLGDARSQTRQNRKMEQPVTGEVRLAGSAIQSSDKEYIPITVVSQNRLDEFRQSFQRNDRCHGFR